MKSRIPLPGPVAIRAVVFAATLAVSAVCSAQSLDRGLLTGANNTVRSIALQRDGSLVVGGEFTTLGSESTGTAVRHAIGRIHADGSLDAAFDPGANGVLRAIVVQPDGKIIVAGSFTAIGGGGTGSTVRHRIARLHPDGSLDTGFDPGAGSHVSALALQPDGKILVGGYFLTIGGGGTGTASRRYLARLNSDGTLDTAFDPGANGAVRTMVVQSDGRILVGGEFLSFGSGQDQVVRSHVARLNANGTVDRSFDASASDRVVAMALQPDRKILVGGLFTLLRGQGQPWTTRNYIGRLNPDGSLDTAFDPGADSHVEDIDVQPDGKSIITGTFRLLSSARRLYIGRLNDDGSLDLSFDPGAGSFIHTAVVQPDNRIVVGGSFTGIGFGIGGLGCRRICRIDPDGTMERDLGMTPNGPVYAIAIQPDSKIIIGGSFTRVVAAVRRSIARIGMSTARDEFFDPGANGEVRTLALQQDGRILVGGTFTALGGGGTLPRNYIGRLHPNGVVDTTFNPAPDARVQAIAVQSDGKILVGGEFWTIGGAERRGLARLNADGSLDPTFRGTVNGDVISVAVQPDGKIVVGGYFSTLGDDVADGLPRHFIGRFNADGSVDPAFNPGANSVVRTLLVQPDGKIVVAGFFFTLANTSRRGIGRLHANGSIDGTFDPGTDGEIYSMALERDGKILLGGNFTRIGGGTGTVERHHVARLHPDGSVDLAFNPGANAPVNAVAIQADGRILIGGAFTGVGGGTGAAPASRLARFGNLDVVNQRLTARLRTGVVWTRTGGPELQRVTFEISEDGLNFTTLGTPTATASGWELHGLDLTAGSVVHLRARGYATGGFRGMSETIVETTAMSYVGHARPFAEDPLLSVHVIRAAHITELRQRIDAAQATAGLAPFTWTDPSLDTGAPIRAVHVTELRTAVQQAYSATGRELPAFTDAVITPGVTVVRVAHVRELREAVIELEIN